MPVRFWFNAFFCCRWRAAKPRFDEIPCKLPASRDFGFRDEFARDSLLQRRVHCEPDLRGQHPIGNTSGAASTARRWPRRASRETDCPNARSGISPSTSWCSAARAMPRCACKRHLQAFPRDAMVLKPCASVFGRCLPEGQREEVKERARLRLPGTECAV